MIVEPNTIEREAGAADRGWLASLALRRGGEWLPRFARYYRQMAAMPRPWRRRLRRKLAMTAGSAALLLALMGPVGGPALAETQAPDATITVVNGEVADVNNGRCSLIEAIINARTTKAAQLRPDCAAGNLSGADTVSLPANGQFVLTDVHNAQFGPTGLPVITSAVIIAGNGATIQRSSVSGTPDFRILAIDDSGRLTLRNVIIKNGSINYYSGAAILNKNSLTMEASQISDSTLRDGGYGAAVFAESGSVTTISGSLIADNANWSQYSDGGGLALAGVATISGTTITRNSAQYSGGVIVLGSGEATITDSVVSYNDSTADYGGVGGGITVGGRATIVNTTVQGNVARGGMDYGGFGGGIAVGGTATISGSTIAGNSATSGGEYGPGAPFDGPGLGGGVFVSSSGVAFITNTTISGNDANRGGGVLNSGEVTIVNSTVTGNTGRRDTDTYNGYVDTQPGRGGGLYSGYPACGLTTLRNTIIAGNTAADGGPEAMIVPQADCTPTVNRDSFNVFGHSGNAGLVGFTKGATDVVPSAGLAAILGPLANNGGPTQTHALVANSPALDLAPNASCAAAPVSGVDQRGAPRNANGKGGATASECDAGSYELQPGGGAFLVSPTGSGAVGGVAFTPADILKYDPATGWSLYFDASDVNVTKNLAAFELLGDGDILMAFAANQPIPGVGTFTPQDIARFTPTAIGPNTAGGFHWELDGSTRGLTTAGEKIDALGDVGDGRLAISTVGAAAVPGPSGTIKAQDEDALGLNRTSGVWSAWFDGTPVRGLAAEDVNALWVDPAGDLYVSIVGAFNLSGVAGNGKDIVKLTKDAGAPGGYTPSLWWDGSAAGFPSNIDGLEILP